jgi:hypothetical protein
MQLAKLEKVDLRNVWKHEASNFTNWLAESENLELLSEEIGIDIRLIQTEASVGKFNVDILAEEENTGRKIVIENQLEVTDHDHLGKIITYASGFDAEIIIWIVKTVRDEHKQAIDWLNEHTDNKINFFSIQMEVWKISDSPFAPKFSVIAQPNNWAKAVKTSSNSNNKLTETKLLQLEFWEKFKDYAEENQYKIKLRKAYAQHWYDVSFGSSLAHITLTINSQSNQITCELYITDSKPLFHELSLHKSDIESKLGYSLSWEELPNKKASRIKTTNSVDFLTVEKWSEYHKWMCENAIKFQNVFSKHVKGSK